MNRIEAELRQMARAHGFDLRDDMTAIEFARRIDAYRRARAEADIAASLVERDAPGDDREWDDPMRGGKEVE